MSASQDHPITQDLWGDWNFSFWQQRNAGVDEVGIGPLAGPVVAAAVLLDPSKPIEGLKDSKQISAKRRAELAVQIRQQSAAWAIAWASEHEIDHFNILQASHLAMSRAIDKLSLTPQLVLVDGNKTPKITIPCIAVVKGDQRIPEISAASILAKEHRDDFMHQVHKQYPGYGFDKHMGYPTKLHMQQLMNLGPCKYHRRSFAPVKKAQALWDEEQGGNTKPQNAPQTELGLV